MNTTTLLADPSAIELECFVSEPESITLLIHSVQAKPICPKCGHPSTSLHSHYTRSVADLPWHGVAIKLQLHTRKLRCHNRLCKQKVFCERLPKVVDVYARKTVRLSSALTLLAFALGGEAGARTACGLNLKASGATLLRRIRRHIRASIETPNILGVDDWAKRKGHSYGTILIDLEKRKPIDLLSDREAETLSQWLKEHPGVRVITRDRSGAYADGARSGAPQAVQVADRWHLLKNLTEAVERSLQSRYGAIASASQVIRQAQINSSTVVIEAGPTTMLSSRKSRQSDLNRERRLARYQEVMKLHKRGASVLAIAQRLKMSRMTVYRYLNSDGFPERAAGKKRRSVLEPYLAYIHQRFAAGCDNATMLWREIVKQGYKGKPAMVRRYMGKLRVRVRAMSESDKQKQLRLQNSFRTPSAKQAARLLLKEEEKLKEDEKSFVCELLRASTEVKQIQQLGQKFQKMVKEKDENAFQEWLKESVQSGIKELVGFADGLNRDLDAVVQAISSKWSNGQTEGQVNRLKLIKRQMYGRAKLDLLKSRVLYRG